MGQEANKNIKVLVINAGSSSIKYQLYQMPQSKVLAKGVLEKIGEESSRLMHTFNGGEHEIKAKIEHHEQGMELILDTLLHEEVGVLKDKSEIAAVGHRVVHGGEEFTGSVVISDKVIASIEKFSDLAPLHNPPNLVGIRAGQKQLPGVVQVACFDTAFHSTIPEYAYLYALPYELYEKYRIRRYGFHGTSHRYVARRAAVLLGVGKYELNAITCHLGNGCSMAAVKDGRSMDTSMGLTPLEGLVMGTRSGDFDPAIMFYLQDKGYRAQQLSNLCNKKSGLLGISGLSNDMRNLTDLAEKGEPRARLAIDIFCYRIKKYIGAYAAALGRLDALIFTGGIGENATGIRQQVCRDLEHLGIAVDPARNQAAVRKESDISAVGSKVKVLVVPTNEELAIAKDTYDLAMSNR